MEFKNLTNCHGQWNRRNKPPRLDLDGGYTGNRYPHCVILLEAWK